MKSELYTILEEITFEFNVNKQKFFEDDGFSNGLYKTGYIPQPGAKRYAPNRQISSTVFFDDDVLNQKLAFFVRSFVSAKKMHDYIIRNNLWHENVEVPENVIRYPSIESAVTGGFLGRIFKINNQLSITPQAFKQAYKELKKFLSKKFVEKEIYIQLFGLSGEYPEIKLTKDAKIVKAGYNIAKLFSQNYSIIYRHNIEMFEDDYVLKIIIRTPKSEYVRSSGNASQIEEKILRKWRMVPIFSCPGFIQIGPQITQSNDWPILFFTATGPYGIASKSWTVF